MTNYPDITPKELDELSAKLTEEFMKKDHGGIFSGVPNNAFSGTPINTEPFHPNPTIDIYLPPQPPIQWSTGEWNGSLIELDSDDPFGDMERIFRRGIHITSITPPEQGWPIAMYCPICKVTTFVLSPWAVNPEKGDYWRFTEMCADSDKHNLEMSMPKIEFKPLDPYAYRLIPGGYVDATGPHRGVPPTQEDAMQIYMMHRHIFSPYDAVIVQEMTIEEAKKRYPDADIKDK